MEETRRTELEMASHHALFSHNCSRLVHDNTESFLVSLAQTRTFLVFHVAFPVASQEAPVSLVVFDQHSALSLGLVQGRIF